MTTCPTCEAHSLDRETLYVHLAAHTAPYSDEYNLRLLSFAIMPSVGRLLHRFGVQLLEWVQHHQLEMDVGCLTGDCPHEDGHQCIAWMLEEFLKEATGTQA